mgnify:FL=1
MINTIGFNLKKYRLLKNLSKMKLAEAADLHFTYISQIERGLRKNLSVLKLKQITDTLGVTLDDIVCKNT